MDVAQKEKTKLERAIDLKAKVMLLLKACSEVSNYLTAKSDSIQKIDAHASEISASLESVLKEKEGMDRALKSVRTEYENKKKELEDLKISADNQISDMKADAAILRNDALTALAVAKAKEAEAGKKLEEVDKLRRELEEKLSAISKIGGK